MGSSWDLKIDEHGPNMTISRNCMFQKIQGEEENSEILGEGEREREKREEGKLPWDPTVKNQEFGAEAKGREEEGSQ